MMYSTRRFRLAAFLVAILAASSTSQVLGGFPFDIRDDAPATLDSGPALLPPVESEAMDFVTGELIVKFHDGVTEEEARQKGLEMLGGLNFEIKRYPTRDLAKASSFLRGKRLEQSQSLSEAGRRIGHTKSLRRLHRRRSIT